VKVVHRKDKQKKHKNRQVHESNPPAFPRAKRILGIPYTYFITRVETGHWPYDLAVYHDAVINASTPTSTYLRCAHGKFLNILLYLREFGAFVVVTRVARGCLLLLIECKRRSFTLMGM
jgi:hypothetical protein